jgi:hypothetical protein
MRSVTLKDLNGGPFLIDGKRYTGIVKTSDGDRAWLPIDPRYDDPKDWQGIIEQLGRPLIKKGILR